MTSRSPITAMTVTTSPVDTWPRAPALSNRSRMRSTSSGVDPSCMTIIISVLPSSISTLRAQSFSAQIVYSVRPAPRAMPATRPAPPGTCRSPQLHLW